MMKGRQEFAVVEEVFNGKPRLIVGCSVTDDDHDDNGYGKAL